MKPDRSFHDHVVFDRMATISGIISRAMFGGWGLYKDGVIFAIIADGELFFKVDDATRGAFEKAGSRPFTYTQGKSKSVTMSYWLLPEEVLEDDAALGAWIDRAVAASRASRPPAKRSRKASR